MVEPSPERAIEVLQGVKASYASHHEVDFDDDAIEAAVRLTHRYLPDRRLPDKAIGVLDLAGSRARRMGAKRVARPLIAALVGELAGLSADKLLMADRERFLDLEKRLMQHIIGHQHVIERVSHTLRRNYAGFVSGRPIGSFLFLGSTGVGKTEFAKALARVLFDDASAMVRIDMSEAPRVALRRAADRLPLPGTSDTTPAGSSPRPSDGGLTSWCCSTRSRRRTPMC